MEAALRQQLGIDKDQGPVVDPFRAPDSTLSKNPLQGSVVRQNPQSQQSPTLTAHQKELLQKKKDWVFVDPDEMGSLPTAEDIFNIKNISSLQNPDENLTPMERYYQKQFDKKKLKDDDSQLKKADPRFSRDDLNLRDKSTTEALMGRIIGQSQSFQPDTDYSAAPKKKNNPDDSSTGYNDPFSSANYGPDAPATAQQARNEVYKKLYGLTVDTGTAPAPVASPLQSFADKPAAPAAAGSFYAPKAPLPVLGFAAPTAPAAPGKPTMDTVAVKDDTSTDKQNPLFVSPSTRLPRRPF